MTTMFRSILLARFSNTPYMYFLNNQSTYLKLLKNNRLLGPSIYVPHIQLPRDKVVNFFTQHDIINKKVLVNVDPSHSLGMNRYLYIQYLKKNVYKNHSEPIDILAKYNPTNSFHIQYLYFSIDNFLLTDYLFSYDVRTLSTAYASYKIISYYNNHIDRGVYRLAKYYKFPIQFLYIFETAFNMDNQIYFSGINYYELRRVVAISTTLDKLKHYFYGCLIYALNKNKSSQQFQLYARYYLWQFKYDILQPLSYQRLNKIRQYLHPVIAFGFPYDFIKPDNNQPINILDASDLQNDNYKIEKHAILYVMLGKLWSQPYTNNPFPYLSDNFHKLSKEDQQLVTEIYNNHYSKYKQAVDKFYELRLTSTQP